jgi:uncharacterized protein
MKIRAHHLLCLQGFQGLGYDEKFIANMKHVINELKSHPEQLIEVTNSCDCICAACPHQKNFLCGKTLTSNNEICLLDDLVLKKANLTAGSILSFSEVNKIIGKKLKNRKDIEEICGNCSWREQCLFFCAMWLINFSHKLIPKTGKLPRFK